jgi:ubiquinone/menaquinone biosynthesis C-methylase UbiE
MPPLKRRRHVSSSGEKVQDFFKSWSKTYDTPFFQDGLYQPLHRILDARAQALTRRGPVDVAVDLGIGTGQSLTWLPQRARQVVGLDYSADMLAKAARRKAEHSVLVRGTAVELPLRDASVDLMVSCFSMHWWPDVQQGWREMHRVLKAGSTTLVLVPSSALLNLPSLKQAWSTTLVHWLPPADYARMARQAGFTMRLPRQVYPTAYLLEGLKA